MVAVMCVPCSWGRDLGGAACLTLHPKPAGSGASQKLLQPRHAHRLLRKPGHDVASFAQPCARMRVICAISPLQRLNRDCGASGRDRFVDDQAYG